MYSSLLTCFILLSIAYASFAANPRTPIDVPFGRNYVPTWAYDHIKYLNAGSEIQLYLDKYTGMLFYFILKSSNEIYFFLFYFLSYIN